MTKITPTALGQCGANIDATGVYDWEKQAYQYATAKFGTFNQTRSGTSSYSGSMIVPDDNNFDSYND